MATQISAGVAEWSVADVVRWACAQSVDSAEAVAAKFEGEEVDGSVLAVFLDSGDFSLLKKDIGLSTGSAARWFREIQQLFEEPARAAKQQAPAGSPRSTVFGGGARVPKALDKEAYLSKSSDDQDALLLVQVAQKGNGLPTAEAAGGASGGAHSPHAREQMNWLDSQTFSAWVGNIPLEHADEASLFTAFASVGLERGALVKITVRVKASESSDSFTAFP